MELEILCKLSPFQLLILTYNYNYSKHNYYNNNVLYILEVIMNNALESMIL